VALLINALMFVLEIGSGLSAGSVALLADAIDFFGDAMNYAVSLAVLAAALRWRARAAQVKAWSMIGFGLVVWISALSALLQGKPPEPQIMGLVAVLALLANMGVAAMLYAYRDGDANMRSVWLCTRNDAIGNLAVGAAALGVWGTASAWPDVLVASLMATLALHGGITVLRQANAELRSATTATVSVQPSHSSAL
jgi:Co/Zn/Cd efflux system component